MVSLAPMEFLKPVQTLAEKALRADTKKRFWIFDFIPDLIFKLS